MGQNELLEIIRQECEANGGYADGKVVRERYGDNFSNDFRLLVQRGYISKSGPVGSISLSPSGWSAAQS